MWWRSGNADIKTNGEMGYSGSVTPGRKARRELFDQLLHHVERCWSPSKNSTRCFHEKVSRGFGRQWLSCLCCIAASLPSTVLLPAPQLDIPSQLIHNHAGSPAVSYTTWSIPQEGLLQAVYQTLSVFMGYYVPTHVSRKQHSRHHQRPSCNSGKSGPTYIVHAVTQHAMPQTNVDATKQMHNLNSWRQVQEMCRILMKFSCCFAYRR